MWREAVAEGTARRAARTSMAAVTPTRLGTNGLPSERSEHAPQALLQRDLRLPAEDLLRARDVRLALLRVVHRQGLVDDLARRARHAQHEIGELEQRELLRVAEVDRQVLARLREQDQAADQVVDVAEGARLLTRAVHRQRG